jgi:hypothetical protein
VSPRVVYELLVPVLSVGVGCRVEREP